MSEKRTVYVSHNNWCPMYHRLSTVKTQGLLRRITYTSLFGLILHANFSNGFSPFTVLIWSVSSETLFTNLKSPVRACLLSISRTAQPVIAIGVSGLKRNFLLFPRCFVKLEVGRETYETKIASRGKSAKWEETFALWVFQGIRPTKYSIFIVDSTAREDQNIVISLYRKSLLGRTYLLGSTTGWVLDVPSDGKIITLLIFRLSQDMV